MRVRGEKCSARSGMEGMRRGRMFLTMGSRLIIGRTSIYAFSRRRRGCSILMGGVRLKMRRRLGGIDRIGVDVING